MNIWVSLLFESYSRYASENPTIEFIFIFVSPLQAPTIQIWAFFEEGERCTLFVDTFYVAIVLNAVQTFWTMTWLLRVETGVFPI